MSPKVVLGSPNSILSYRSLSTSYTVLITLALVLILYLVSIIVTVSHKLIASSMPSYPTHLDNGINSIFQFCFGKSHLLSMKYCWAIVASLAVVGSSFSSNLLLKSSSEMKGCE